MRLLALGIACLSLFGGERLIAQVDPIDQAPSRFATYQGIKVHYKNLGIGRTALVFVHGWACDLTVWRGQVPQLDGRVRMILLDLPGHGRSDKPNVEYSMDLFAGAVNAVIEAAQADRVILVGHSMGTPVIRQFYRKFPAKVVGLVAVDGALKRPAIDSAQLSTMVAQFAGPGYRDAFDKMIGSMYPADSQAVLRRRLVGIASSTPQYVVTSSMREMMSPKIWGDDPIAVPVLVVVAKATSWPPNYRAQLSGLVPDLRYEELDGVNHFLMIERPDLFNHALVDFLRSLKFLRA